MAFVAVYYKSTGKKAPHLVPEAWLDHPVLGRDLSRLPSDQPKVDRKKATTTKGVGHQDPVTITTEAPAVGDDKKE